MWGMHKFKIWGSKMPLKSPDDIEVHVTWLEGLGASYRIKGYFIVAPETNQSKVEFDAVAFGGNYGGHNVNVQIDDAAKKLLMQSSNLTDEQVEELISEVQRKMLNNEMIVEYEKLKPETGQDPFENMAPDH
jgi:hypothetical protein